MSIFVKQITIGDLLINYHTNGLEGSKTLVFLHGWRSEGAVWLPIVKNLQETNSIYCLDLPGFGKSQHPEEAWGVGDYADVVSAFIMKLELKNAILIGHSFGGRVAIKLASRRPEFLEGVVLVDSAGFVDKTLSKQLKRIIARPLHILFKYKEVKAIRDSIYRWMGAEDYIATPKLTKTYLKIINEDLSHDMTRINVPVEIIWGDCDKATPLSLSHRMNKLIFSSKLVILKDAGHFSFLDKPQEFLDVFKNYLSRL